MGLLKTKVALKGGGPCDGDEKILPNGQLLFLAARVYLSRDKLGALTVIQDTMCPHAYVRLDKKVFAYDGLRIVEVEPPVPVELRSFI